MRAGGGPGRWKGFNYEQWPFTMRRPPWWPEGEPFPPRRWGRRRGYGPAPFLRFIGCLFFSALLVTALGGALVGSLVGRLGPVGAVLLAILLFFLISGAVGGAMRRASRPMDRLVDAARRIESGDYSTQVPEWGSPDIRSVARAFNSMSARLKTTDEQRRSFMADVTHELRTPLSVIRGQAEAISDGLYPADHEHLAPILDATQTLDRLVDDLRTLVQTDAGNLVLHREATDMGALVHDAVESFRSQADSKGVSLTDEIGQRLPPVDVDPARMRQVLGNLVSNSLQHTPAGGSITVTTTAANDQLTIVVADTGEGIPPDLLPHVFERFVKGPNSAGSGLGLAIAHDIVVAHGGRLDVESKDGEGTRVSVSMQLSAR
jgi:signal transduction histidine kinase